MQVLHCGRCGTRVAFEALRPGNLQRWAALERTKRRLLCTLPRLGLGLGLGLELAPLPMKVRLLESLPGEPAVPTACRCATSTAGRNSPCWATGGTRWRTACCWWQDPAADRLAKTEWLPLASFLNEWSAALGTEPADPFALPPTVLHKMRTVQALLARAAG